MFRSLYLSMIYAAFLCGGVVAPFAMGLGYVWVDTFQPQRVAYSILSEMPISLIIGMATACAYLLRDRRSPPRPDATILLMLLMAGWVTFTTWNNPVVPIQAWQKWNWAIKTILFSAFMPWLFRSRVQIEAFLQIYLFSTFVQILPYAAKTIVSGGSYGANLGLLEGNSGLAEGSMLSTVCLMMLPVCLWLRSSRLLLPQGWLWDFMYIGMAFACIVASTGTFERTAVIGMAVICFGYWLRSKHKLRWTLGGGALLAVAVSVVLNMDTPWAQRMMTISQYNSEGSALGRLLVWQWTLGYVGQHPLGGGFNAFMIDTIHFPPTLDNPDGLVIHGKAFHSIFFEVLGEHGWIGLAILFGLILFSFRALFRVSRVAGRHPDLLWARDLARSLIISEATVLACGCFIGIAFQPVVYYQFALAAMLNHHVRSAERVRLGLDTRKAPALLPGALEPQPV